MGGREGGKRAGKTRMMVAGMGSCGDALQAVDHSGNKLETERFHCLLLLLLNSWIRKFRHWALYWAARKNLV